MLTLFKRQLLLITCLPLLAGIGSAVAEQLDEAVASDDLLSLLAAELDALQIDVIHNLNDRSLARGRPDRPRLGRFPDLPLNTYVSSEELENWEAEYAALDIGAVVILANGRGAQSVDDRMFLEDWLDAAPSERIFVTFYREDSGAAERIASVSNSVGHQSFLYREGDELARVGNFYATAAQRLAIDSREARRYKTRVTELEFLGERVRRNLDSLFRNPVDLGDARVARSEPAIFRKESLGDEFTQSTIEEIVVPGGVALGETARLSVELAEMIYDKNQLILIDKKGERWQLPELDIKSVKALFDFVRRSERIRSDAIVDIDAEGRVKISSQLRDTDAGFEIMHADTQPFNYVRNLDVTKSVVVDRRVRWFPDDIRADQRVLAFDTDYEVRFLSADNMRIAQTRVALEYHYRSVAGQSEYRDAWGRYSGRLRESLDYAGLGSSMAEVAQYAGWIGLFRMLHEEQLPFMQGRYQFMKLDKSGKRTPTRY